MSTAHSDELKRALWAGTIGNAAQAAVYAQLWHPLGLAEIVQEGPAGLSRLPVVDKAAIIQSGDAGRVKGRSPCHDVLTGGTTGNPMRIQRSEKEIRFLHDFFVPDQQRQHEKRRGFCFTAPYHGTQVPLQSGAHLHRINIYDSQSFNYALEVLQTEYADENIERRCSFIAGQERVLNAFALFLEDRDTCQSFDLKFAFTQGSHVTPAVRERIETQLNCTLIDRYSMSEVFGGASENLCTGWYHPDPHLIYEVVHPASQEPVTSGVGDLLVTVLFPFQQTQPLIRYRTGDLAEIPVGAQSQYGVEIFRPMGRRAHSIFSHAGRDVALPAAALYDALFEFTGAKRSPLFLDAPHSVSEPVRAGLPAFRLFASDDGRAWSLEFALAEDWAAEAAESQLRRALLENSCGQLANFIDRGEVDLTIRAVTPFA